jgi:hypothetical protein
MLPPSPTGSALCKFQGFLTSFSGLSGLMLTACMMFSLYRLIIFDDIGKRYLEWVYLVLVWPCMGLIAVIPINEYSSQNNGWCWVQTNVFYILLGFYGPYCIVLVINIVLCWKINRYLNHCDQEKEILVAKKAAFKQFVYYPIILILFYAPLGIRRFGIVFNIDIFEFNVISIILECGFIIFCAIIYAFTKYIRTRVFACCYTRSAIADHANNNELLS